MRLVLLPMVLAGCASVPAPATLEVCGLTDGRPRNGEELLSVPDAACGDALLADLGATRAERASVAWEDNLDGGATLALALWGLLAADFGAVGPDAAAPASFAAELEGLSSAEGTPLGHALYAYVLARVDAVHPLSADWMFRLDPDLRSMGYPNISSAGDPGERAIALVHAASHADASRTHLDCGEEETVDEGPDATWGGAQSITIWLTTRLYENAEGDVRASLEERLPLLVGGLCGLEGVPDDLWTRMNARPLTASP